MVIDRSMAKVGVVILNYITWQETERCIQSVKASENSDDIKIYVVDNASPEVDKLQEVCEREQVELIRNMDNKGYAAGNNVGILRAMEDGCDYILISNNDILYQQESICMMQKFLEKHSEYGIVGSRVVDRDGNLQRCHFKKKASYGDIWGTQTILRYVIKKPTDILYGDEKFYETKQDVFAVSGCCFLMRRDCASQVTPLDEMTFLYEEENILGIRMEQAGMKTAYLPECQVTHNHDQTTRLVKPFALICWACSEIYYCKEYLKLGWWKVHILYWYRILIFLLHGVRDKAYRQQWRKFREETKKYLRMR